MLFKHILLQLFYISIKKKESWISLLQDSPHIIMMQKHQQCWFTNQSTIRVPQYILSGLSPKTTTRPQRTAKTTILAMWFTLSKTRVQFQNNVHITRRRMASSAVFLCRDQVAPGNGPTTMKILIFFFKFF